MSNNDFLIWTTTTFGISLVLTQSKILKSTRETILKYSEFFGTLVKCIMCLGFWIGLFYSLVFSIGPNVGKINNIIVRSIFDGFASSGFVWFVYVILYRYFQDPVEE